jgi:EAL domain-containing protein (putative c-di-GMP-specific phosphodiesterase class I)
LSLAEIEAALANHEFIPFLQPKVDMKSGAVVGAEALARWKHPAQGIVAPYAFILKLEKAGPIDALTFLMLEQAAHATRRLHEAGLDITLSVNLSTTSLADVTLADRVTAIVTGCSDNPSAQVIIEASIGLAHGLKLKTVAEGIETQADWETLRGMGCDFAQGYFIAHPMDEAGFLQFCQSRAQPAPGA